MATDVVVPAAGESISEVYIGTWLKQPGEAVAVDEAVVEVETDKATLEIPSPVAGVLLEQLKGVGDAAGIGEVIARIDETATVAAAPAAAEPAAAPTPAAPAPPAPVPAAAPAAAQVAQVAQVAPVQLPGVKATSVMPAAQRMLDENALAADDVPATGPGGRLLKEDVQNYLLARERNAAQASGAAAPAAAPLAERSEEIVPMTLLRRRIAERLVEAQQTAALLTTFNEADMSAVIELRKQYRDEFEKKYDVRLGFMSFFVKAAIEALRRFPAVNASIDGNDIVYHEFYDIGVAVSTDRGLMVPVLRNAENMSFAEIEKAVGAYATKAREGSITLEELTGGTFTLTNGGVFGSLMSTPILNPPQVAILGMHKIQERPMVINGEIKIRPMMYLALTYDHRIVDGRESVQFLVAIKDALEDPARLLLQL
jgi:2-oxoglutarate dehydrogenase E2 component (dihydrolipoamide succinyltransferase)